MSPSTGSLTAVDLPLIAPAERNRLASLLPGAEKVLDFLTVAGAVYLSLGLYQTVQPHRAFSCGGSTVFLWISFFALLFVFLMERHGGYRPSVSLLAIRETERILRVTLQAFLLAALAVYFCAAPISRLAFCLTLVTVPLFLTLEKREAGRLLRRLRGKGYGSQRAVILGTGPESRRIFSALVRSPKFGVDPIAFIDDDPHGGTTEIYESTYHSRHSAKVLAGPACPELLRQLSASVLIIATSAIDRESLLPMIAQASAAGVRTFFAPGDFLGPGQRLEFTELDGVMLAHLPSGTSPGTYELAKRLLDVFVSTVLLLPLAPVAAILALLVKTTSSGPILFRQQRVGQDGRRFTIYKFRTMYRDAPHYEYSPGSGDDPRVTPLGRILRHTSLDELPQLLNVLLGQMSLVGPRPEMPFIAEQYDAALRQRLAVKPGMTGLWQISPYRSLPIHQHPEYDDYYFRLNIIYIQVPSLRERVEDIPSLTQNLLRSIARGHGAEEVSISSAAMTTLQRYSWPGNIRELRNVLERAVLVAGNSTIRAEHLYLQAPAVEGSRLTVVGGTLKQMECAYIHHVLHDEGGSIERTARRLGIPRSSLYNKMRRFEIPQGTGRL